MSRFPGFVVFLLITAGALALYLGHASFVEKQELGLYDLWLSSRGPVPPTGEVTVVAIDDHAVQRVGRWPWNRIQTAALVDAIARFKPAAIGFDVEFQHDALQDSLGFTDTLAAAVARAGNVYLATHFSFDPADTFDVAETPRRLLNSTYVLFDDPGLFRDFPPPIATRVHPPVEKLVQAAAGFGHINAAIDPDGAIRWEACVVKYGESYYPSLSVALACAAKCGNRGDLRMNVGRSLDIASVRNPLDHEGRMLINYPGGFQAMPYVSAGDVLSGAADSSKLAGRIVIVGLTAAGSTDFYRTPFAPLVPGVEKLAAATDNLVGGTALARNELSVILDVWLIAFTGVLLGLFLPRLRFGFRVLTLVIAIAATGAVAYAGLAMLGLWIKSFVPALMLTLFAFASVFVPRQVEVAAEEGEEEVGHEGVTMKIDTRKFALAGGMLPAPGTTTRLGRYEVIDVLGKGAMGTVYKGRDPAIDRVVALKTIRLDFIMGADEVRELRARLYREAQAAGKLTHPNIITVYDVGEEEGLSYIAMEFLQGRTLESRLAGGAKLPPKQVAQVAAQVADALGYAHKMGVVHRDIKPANIMVKDDMSVKVMDFGIARIQSSSITQEGVALGTPNYVAPEQLQGKPVDGRADLFSLGVVMYESLSGKRPFGGADISSLIYSILNTEPEPLAQETPGLPAEIDAIVIRCLTKEPDKRFQTAEELASALRSMTPRL